MTAAPQKIITSTDKKTVAKEVNFDSQVLIASTLLDGFVGFTEVSLGKRMKHN